MQFKDKVAVITGAGNGIGRATALAFAAREAKVVVVDRSGDDAERTVATIRQQGGDARHHVADVTKSADVAAYVRAALDAYGRIDCFFNNAGIEGKQAVTEDYDCQMFHKVIDINLNGVFYGMKHVLQVMKQQGFGAIVNTASVGGIRGIGNQSGYAASKHGVVGLTRNSAVEYGQYGININAIAPGAIMTPMVEGSLKQIGGDNWEAVGAEFVSANPMKRFGKPEEVANLVSFLLSSEATFINAAVIPIDGGQSYKY